MRKTERVLRKALVARSNGTSKGFGKLDQMLQNSSSQRKEGIE